MQKLSDERDQYWLNYALGLASRAQTCDEVPVGAVLVKDNQLIAEGWNQPISQCDPSAHAEIITLRHAGQILKNYRLTETTLYVTLEPCAMCAGAMIQARIARLVFGAFDTRAGAAGSVFNILQHSQLNHRVDVLGGVMANECSEMLKKFFLSRR